jgi:hypothetical protein
MAKDRQVLTTLVETWRSKAADLRAGEKDETLDEQLQSSAGAYIYELCARQLQEVLPQVDCPATDGSRLNLPATGTEQ